MIFQESKNYDIDILDTENFYSLEKSYIIWVNENDSIFTIYLKNFSPTMEDNIIISSDSIAKSNPQISKSNGLKIAWQNYIGNYYQIILCDYLNDSLYNRTIISDSLLENPEISLSAHRIAWIENGNLYYKNIFPVLSESILIDSINCYSPNILKDDSEKYAQILYIKEQNYNQSVFLANYRGDLTPYWNKSIISDGINKNPQFGFMEWISFEHFDQNVWKIKYSYNGDNNYLKITNNKNCNFKNSQIFSYAIATGSEKINTPFFISFDSDSIEGNNEIFIKTFMYNSEDSILNISNMEGDDCLPQIAYREMNNIIYVSIFWINKNKSKNNIWMASTIFNPIIGSVSDKNISSKYFQLFQNYPNPFNPFTNIEYYIERTSNVHIGVYNIIGQKVITLKDGIEQSGKHKIIFNGNGLESGNYIYSINIDGDIKSKFMTLVK